MSWRSLVLCKKSQSAQFGRLGFGLVELMVAISVMVIVLSIILSRQDAFNGAVLLRNQAYEIALAAREVQLSAVSASGGTGDFRNEYGLYFNSTSIWNGEYQMYRDATSGSDDDGFYSGSSEDFGGRSKLDDRFEIREIRIIDGSTTDIPDEVSVVFARPNFDAVIYDAANSPVSGATVEIDVARRGSVGSGPGDMRTIEITSTGQIAVQ